MEVKDIKILHIDSNHPLLWDQLEQAGFTNEADFTSTNKKWKTRLKITTELSLEAVLKLINLFR